MRILKKIGCLFIYTIFVLIVGMGLYRYRAQVLKFLNVKYDQAVVYVKDTANKAVDVVDDVDLPKITE